MEDADRSMDLIDELTQLAGYTGFRDLDFYGHKKVPPYLDAFGGVKTH